MNVDTQGHLPTLRGLLTFRIRELSADLHALQLARERLLSDVAATEVTDQKDEAQASQESDLSDAAQDRMRFELKQHEQALQRMDDERYGDCVDCEEPIPWPRLLAQPAAERCADCQRAFERRAQGAS